MTTIREVAEKAGVSSATVSHVINKTRFVSVVVQERVRKSMDELGYHPNALARSLRRGETKTIGLILPDSANPFFAEIGRAIENAAFESEYSVVLCNTENDQNKERLYTEVLEDKQVDGMIFVAAGDQTDSLHRLIQGKLPVVLVDRDLPSLEVDTVLSDNFLGGRLATQHLIDLNHQRIGCITGPSNLNPSAKRVAGYRAALMDAGIPLDETLIIRGDFHPESGRLAALELLGLSNRPTAIFVCNDMMAVGALRAAMESGLRVPEDLSLIGYDDIELACYTTPPLTTIQQYKMEVGRVAVEILVNRINKKQLNPQRLTLPVSLVVRGSCQEQIK
jgi:LacI family transcriptional regulator